MRTKQRELIMGLVLGVLALGVLLGALFIEDAQTEPRPPLGWQSWAINVDVDDTGMEVEGQAAGATMWLPNDRVWMGQYTCVNLHPTGTPRQWMINFYYMDTQWSTTVYFGGWFCVQASIDHVFKKVQFAGFPISGNLGRSRIEPEIVVSDTDLEWSNP